MKCGYPSFGGCVSTNYQQDGTMLGSPMRASNRGAWKCPCPQAATWLDFGPSARVVFADLSLGFAKNAALAHWGKSIAQKYIHMRLRQERLEPEMGKPGHLTGSSRLQADCRTAHCQNVCKVSEMVLFAGKHGLPMGLSQIKKPPAKRGFF